MNGASIQFKMDTGAEVTAISKQTYEALKKPKLAEANRILYGPSRTQRNVIGAFDATLSSSKKAVEQTIFVVDGLKTNLLGLPAIKALKLVVQMDTTESEEILQKFPTLFQTNMRSN